MVSKEDLYKIDPEYKKQASRESSKRNREKKKKEREKEKRGKGGRYLVENLCAR